MNKNLLKLGEKIRKAKDATAVSYKQVQEEECITVTEAFVQGMALGAKAKTKTERTEFAWWWLDNMC